MVKKIAVVSLFGAGAIGLTACNITPNGQFNYGGDTGGSVSSYTPSYDGGSVSSYSEEPAPPSGWQQAQEPTYPTNDWYEPAPVANCGYSATGVYFCD